MNTATANFKVRQIPVLLGGRPDALKDWAARWETSRLFGYTLVWLDSIKQ